LKLAEAERKPSETSVEIIVIAIIHYSRVRESANPRGSVSMKDRRGGEEGRGGEGRGILNKNTRGERISLAETQDETRAE